MLVRAASRVASILALATILAAGAALPAGAADRWFMVEIVVFDDLRNEALHDEQWPVDPGEPSLGGAIELAPRPESVSEGAGHGYRLAKPSHLELGPVRQRLRRSAHYRPFLHAGWRLPGLPRRSARPVHIGSHLGGGRTKAAAPDGGDRTPSVHGTVTVSLARYLQVDVDLLYHRPSGGEAAGPESVPARFRLVSERRMRSGELHYLDHPLFGVLIRITRA